MKKSEHDMKAVFREVTQEQHNYGSDLNDTIMALNRKYPDVDAIQTIAIIGRIIGGAISDWDDVHQEAAMRTLFANVKQAMHDMKDQPEISQVPN